MLIAPMSLSLFGVLTSLLFSSSFAESLPFAPNLDESGWQIIEVPDQSPNDMQVTEQGTLQVSSNGTVSFLVREVEAGASATLSWEWRVEQGFVARNLDTPGQDDRPAAVHVWFPDRSRDLFSWLGGGLKDLLGYPVFGKAITYVWGAEQPAGTLMSNPFMEDGAGVMILLRPDSSPQASWFAERRNLAEDYQRAFGAEVQAPAYVAISADTDDTGAVARFAVRNLLISSEGE